MVVADPADGSGADCTTEADGIIMLMLTWHRICRYQLYFLFLLAVCVLEKWVNVGLAC